MDCFFVSVERLYDPSLADRAVVVGADPGGRGVVCAASYEARRFGVHSAMPISQAVRLCPEAVFLRPRGRRYRYYSARVRSLLEDFAPEVRPASIDEFDCDLTGCERLYAGDLFGACRGIQQKVHRVLGLPCSIGLATTRMVAKVAAGRDKPAGAVYVPAGEEERFLGPLPAESLPGVGPKLRPWLRQLGVRTVGDLAGLGSRYLENTLGRVGRSLYLRALGGEDGGQLPLSEGQKSISRESTFGSDTEDPQRIRRTLSVLCEDVCRQLRACGARTRVIGLKLRYSDFRTITREQRVYPTDLDQEIFRVVLGLWKQHDTRRIRIRLVGVKLANLESGACQGLLFDALGPRPRALQTAMDGLVGRYGTGIIRFGRSLDEV